MKRAKTIKCHFKTIYFVRQNKYITKPNYTQALKRFFEVEIIIF
nr:MAG TPA: Peptidoglycan-binding protein [Caudoviricetes sp.]